MAINGDLIVVGAPRMIGDKGKAYIYKRDGTFIKELEGANGGDYFGAVLCPFVCLSVLPLLCV